MFWRQAYSETNAGTAANQILLIPSARLSPPQQAAAGPQHFIQHFRRPTLKMVVLLGYLQRNVSSMYHAINAYLSSSDFN
jgi:hypothetical protein